MVASEDASCKAPLIVSLSAIVEPEKAADLRIIWLSKGTTLGLKERMEGRWVLPRRKGFCDTSFGKVLVKQVRRPDGRLTIKPENDEVIKRSLESGKSTDEVRMEVLLASKDFIAQEDWTW